MKANSFQNYLEGLHRKHANIDTGAAASYIPELLKADPAWLGIALIMVDGHVYQAGDFPATVYHTVYLQGHYLRPRPGRSGY